MSAPVAVGATIRIYLVDGTPQGLRVVDKIGWTGSCLAFARADYGTARSRPEVMRTGAYLLLGPDPAGHRPHRLYIGEADEVRARLDLHQKEKEFWTHGFVLSTKDESLNKAHVRYLEARLLEQARLADNAVVDNGTAPPRPHLAEAEVADMEAYLSNALTLLPLVGVHAFEVPEPEASRSPTSTATHVAKGTAISGGARTYYLKSPKTDAEGRDDAKGFTVFEGALGRAETKVMIPVYRELRQRLLAEGILVPHGTDQIRLTKTYVFDSPSSAASVLGGGSKNGRIEWKDAAGRSLKQNQEATTVA